MTIILATSVDETYKNSDRGRNYLTKWIESVNQNYYGIKPYLFTVDCTVNDTGQIQVIPLNGETQKAQNLNNCIQHGEFLRYLPSAKQRDTIIFTDADITMQRQFTKNELVYLDQFPEGAIGMTPNAGDHDTMMDEANRIKPMIPIEYIHDVILRGTNPTCFNAGVIAAKKKTYQQLYDRYVELWPEFSAMFDHIAAQQWLINYIANIEMTAEWMPGALHIHSHYGIQPNVEINNGWAYYKKQMVVFRHKI